MPELIVKIQNRIKNSFLIIILLFVCFFFFIYIFSIKFRYFLSCLNIDPNFILAFVAIITLVLSMIENQKTRKILISENNKERKYNFDLNLDNFTRERVETVIGKLFTIMNDSSNYLQTIIDIKNAINTNKKLVDVNNILSLDDIKKNKEIIGAYITMYFGPYIQDDWNLMSGKINKIATNCSMALNNYNENYSLIGKESFKNETLSNIHTTILESEKLNEDIYKLTEKMKNILLEIVVKNQNKLKDKYIN